jgi:hypothetical protein
MHKVPAREPAKHHTVPDQARAICAGIIQLYSDKAWAAPAVARARKISAAIAA